MKAKSIILFIFFIVLGVGKSKAGHFISGKVSNQNYEALNGVIVYANNRQQGVRTDHLGLFSIEADSNSHSLIFSLPGMESMEIPIQQQKEFNVLMVESVPKPVPFQASHPHKTGIQQTVLQSKPGVFVKDAHSGMMLYPDPQRYNTENYATIHENKFQLTTEQALSTFSIDVDRASYPNIRRFINSGQLPPKDAVRIEEMINYFQYDYPVPIDNEVLSMTTAYTTCPWNNQHQLLFIGLQGKEIKNEQLPPANLVFLIDVSGSMQAMNKLPMVKTSMKMLVNQLRESDRISIVSYAGAAQIVLNATLVENKKAIHETIDGLRAGGSTAGADGLKLAYRVASDHFDQNGNNRIIMATDGDFNVGQSSDAEMERLVREQALHQISLTVLGFGMGNLKDNRLEQMAQNGNGNYAYIDNSQEAYRTLIAAYSSTMFTIVSNVKIQAEFNPALVKAYRQVGYENQKLDQQDFNNKKRDASDLGAGQQVTFIFEIIPAASEENLQEMNPLRYQQSKPIDHHRNELAFIRINYRDAANEQDQLRQHLVNNNLLAINDVPKSFLLAAGVAQFGLLLRDSSYKGNASIVSTEELVDKAQQVGRNEEREELLGLLRASEVLGLEKK